MKQLFRIVFAVFALTLVLVPLGCGNKLSPLSPELKQQVDTQGGKIEELKNNQNGLNLEFGKLRSQQQVQAEKLDNLQSGFVNLKGNSGIQIFSGDGAIMALFGLCVVAMVLVYHFRSKAVKNEKAANILAQQIASHGDVNLENQVFMAALNTGVEEEVFNLMAGRRPRRN
jgi:predicted PurR-regulated permease PerM